MLSLVLPLVLIQQGQSFPFQNPNLPVEQRVDDLVSRMTLEEKVSQMMHGAAAIPRLGIPAYNWWNEGLHGVAWNGIATVFPQAIGMASTWDSDLVHQVATAISDEARAKHSEALRHDIHDIFTGLTFWSPNINIFRDPRWGRGQETYGEDPYLTSRLGVQFVKGLQGDDPKYFKVIATPKHYAVHSGPDPMRHKFNAVVNQHDLWDTYLPAFQATITEAGAYSIMGAYSAVNGEPCCASPTLLEKILREKWGFKGYVVSDCGAIGDILYGHKAVDSEAAAAAIAIKNGCDLECGDTYKATIEAVHEGLLTEADIDTCVKRLMTARMKLGMFDPDSMVKYTKIPMSVVDSKAHRELALKSARESIVLLKNDGILPIKKSVKSIAVIGPNANDPNVLLGNYNGQPSKSYTPFQGLQERLKSSGVSVNYVKGSDLLRESPLVPIPAEAFPEGLKTEYYNNRDLSGHWVFSTTEKMIDHAWGENAPAEEVNPDNFSVRWTGKLKAPVSGNYELAVTNDDGARLWIDGELLIDDWSEHSPRTTSVNIDLEGGKTYDVKMEYYEAAVGAEAHLSWAKPGAQNYEDVLKVVNASDLAIVCLGINTTVENEENDRDSIDLPAVQQKLLEAVAATGKPTILVLLNGSMLAVNWADEHLPAIVEAWYPGEEGGTALADVLLGRYNPSGRLPVTFYKSLDQVPPFEDYDMSNRTYRYFGGEPLYPFGYGLSYTSFAYSEPKVDKGRNGSITVSSRVTNTGSVEGDEVTQLYVAYDHEGMPKKALKGFGRLHLRPGESKTVVIKTSLADLAPIGQDGTKVIPSWDLRLFIGGGQPGTTRKTAGQWVTLKM